MENINMLDEQNIKRTFSKTEVFFVWFCVFCGYLLCRTIPVFRKPFGAFCFLLILFVGTLFTFCIKKIKINKYPVAIFVSAILLTFGIIFTSNAILQTLSFILAFGCYFYFVYSTFENYIDKAVTDYLLFDYFKSIFIIPFACLKEGIAALSINKSKEGIKVIAKALLGIVIAIVPTSIVIAQLSYDNEFTKMLQNIFSFDFADIFSQIFSILFGFAIGFYLFSLYISSTDRKLEKALTVDNCNEIASTFRILPMTTGVFAVIPILFVYAVYFVSQWNYYVGAFTGFLPDNLSFSGYAREGFFQLCIVSFFNLIIIGAISLFIKKMKKSDFIIIRIINILYSLFTLILISTAFSKMVMYIDKYGLTPKRVYASWFMIVLAVIFILMIIKQFLPRFKVVFSSVVSFVILFTALNFANPDALIAKYNVERCLTDYFELSDIESITNLGDSAIPYAAKLYQEKGGTYFECYLINTKISFEKDNNLFSYTLPKLKARAAIEKLDF